jgi:hypothetical protein
MNAELTNQFPRYVSVHVTRRSDDDFNHDFTGDVVGYHNGCVTVRDQDGDCWDCEPEQLVIADIEI